MLRSTAAAALLAVVVGVVPPAQEAAVAIRFKSHADAGKNVVVKDKDKESVTVKLTDAAGKVVQRQTTTETFENVYTETVLEKGDRQPKKFKRVYDKATADDGKKTSNRSYHGRGVRFELKDGKYQLAVEGLPALEAPDAQALLEQVNDPTAETEMDRIIVPKKAVKPGDAWSIDGKELAAALAKTAELDPDKTKAGAKLLRVYQKDGAQFGVLEVELKMAVKKVKDVKFETPAVFELKGTIDGAIDGSSTARTTAMTGKMSGTGVIEDSGKKFTVELSMEMSGARERSAEK